MKTTAFTWLLALSVPFIVSACNDPPNREAIRAHKRMLARRQNTVAGAGTTSSSSSSAPAATNNSHPPSSSSHPLSSSTIPPLGPAPTSPGPSPTVTGTPSSPATPVPPFTPPTDPFATIPLVDITSGAPSEALPTLSTTWAAGGTAFSGAPPLPSLTLNPSNYPPENTPPPTDSPQVKTWMAEIAGISQDLLNIPPTKDGSCASDPQAAADTSRCWWTCGGCTNNTAGVEDVVVCPDKLTWGLSFDDGPAPYTPKVLKYLSDKDLSATFFIVGSRVMERPDILRAEYMAGHHIAVHTWSHAVPLTALTTEQVVAELGWAREAIREVTGVSPLFMRPPWGDIDNRVRAISLAMGMRPIIWTRNPQTGEQFDTNDWRVPGGQFTGTQSFQQFQYILSNATELNTGFIVLQHDLFEQTVDLATGYSIPAALQHNFNLMDINKCLHQQPQDAYLETIADKSKVPTFPGAGSVDVSGNGTGVPGTGNGTSAGASAGGAIAVSIPWTIISSVAAAVVMGTILML